jgi:hypothetical protein
MPPAPLQAREHAPIRREPRSISGAVFDFVVIPFLTLLILMMIYEIAHQLWLVDGHFL